MPAVFNDDEKFEMNAKEQGKEGKIDIDSLITHTLSLDDINEGFRLMKAGESIRSVVIY